MLEAIKTMTNWFQLYYADGFFLVLTIVSFIYLFITSKNLRMRFLLPIAMLVFCVANPILYILVLKRVIYWRLFWMVPDAIIIACAFVSILKRIKNEWIKLLLILGLTILIMGNGTNAFVHGNFSKVENWVKLPQAVVEICDFIQETDPDAKVIFPRSLYSDVRQYAPEIEMLYGRNADGFIYSCPLSYMFVKWRMDKEAPDFYYIFEHAKEYRCKFVVVEEQRISDLSAPISYEYEEAARISDYIIFYNPKIV